jgi:hypothetical protein
MKNIFKGLTEDESKRILSLHKNLITEVAGISDNSRAFTNIIYNHLRPNGGGLNWDDVVHIKGEDYPDAYEKFPIKNIIVQLTRDINKYDEEKSSLSHIYLFISGKLSEGKMKSVINHELKHAYEDFMMKLKGGSLSNTTEVKKLFTNDFYEKLKTGPRTAIWNIFYLFYILSKVEQSAFLENIYDNENIFDSHLPIFINGFLQKPINIDDKEWETLKKKDIPILKKFKTKEEFGTFAKKEIEKRWEKFRRKINKMGYLHGLVINQPNSNIYAKRKSETEKDYDVFNTPSNVYKIIRYDKYGNKFSSSDLSNREIKTIYGNTPEEVLAKIDADLKDRKKSKNTLPITI